MESGRQLPGGQRIRKVAGYVLLGSGLAAIAAAIALPTWAMPRLMKIPGDIRVDTVSIAEDSKLIDAGALRRGRAATETGVPLHIQVLVKSVGSADDSHVTLQASTRMLRTDITGPEQMVSAHVDKVTLDRATSRPTDPPGLVSNELGEVEQAPRSGFQYQFPFGVEKSAYPYFDEVSRTEPDAVYIDDTRREGGLRLLHFRQEVGPVDLRLTQPDAELTLPASWWGLPGDEPTRFDLWYSNTRDIWVEPTSGVVVAVEEHPHRRLARSLDDPLQVTTLEAHTRFDDETLADTIATARNARTLIQWGNVYAPIALAVAGTIAALAGSALLWRTTRAGVDRRDVAGVGEHDAQRRHHLPVQDVAMEQDL
ncbi:DUF3068 domain-containing protein [Nocardia wallacei]|uniref:DUF3068 domain-containing protein n=1 Tax=Nocardia wallacei TaxID=480035 RepID=UPI002453ED87|nr:DUF3068 domain-containing protein [Nocardia wallacei]